MVPDRSRLTAAAKIELAGAVLDIRWNQDRRRYTLAELLPGQGMTSITWKAYDSLDRAFAIKFVLRADYLRHSLHAEARRANSLAGQLFAKIDFFGEPVLHKEAIPTDEFYAIVVEWVSGRTLDEYLNDATTEVSPELYRRLTRDLCEALQSLKGQHLVHNDLHGRNLLVRTVLDNLSGDDTLQLVVIDTGHLKTEERRNELLDSWQQVISTLEALERETPAAADVALRRYRTLVHYFSRTDQEWIVCHLCSLYNCMRRSLSNLESVGKRFVDQVPESLKRMVDPDPSRRMDDPRQMYGEIERLWKESLGPLDRKRGMISPFDLPSAELIRSDEQLMALFSEEYPRLGLCRSEAPVYLYGPRGCGKSTILRALSLKAALASNHPSEEIKKVPFVGVYLSSSQELRSRFWLMRDDDFDVLEGHVVRYFNLLLVEALLDTLDRMHRWDIDLHTDLVFGMTDDVAAHCAVAIRSRLGLDREELRYARTSCLGALRQQIRRTRDDLWLRILNRTESAFRPDAQLIFDVCRDVEDVCHFLKQHRLCFLVDDYSNQRIPVALQKKLNQAITFSKQGSPIFKVTSEYDGVDLEGVEEGREVNEVNVGFEYVSFQNDPQRYRFLYNVLQRRFRYLDLHGDVLAFLPLSGLKPTVPLARAIRNASQGHHKFHYHGFDIISDLCSGDFAMGIDLIRRIFEQAGVKWHEEPRAIPAAIQDAAIREYTKQEFEYIRYHARYGRRQYGIADSLCWLSRQCILHKDTEKKEKKKGNVRIVPVVKNHLDIAEVALRELEERSPADAAVVRELVSKGILFPIQDSRSRRGHHATRRLMVRRILLARYTTALGRDQPIRIDDLQRLIFFLSEPAEFVKDEYARTSVGRNHALKQDAQMSFLPPVEATDDDA